MKAIALVFLLAACGSAIGPDFCATTGYQSLPLVSKHADPDSATITTTIVAADPPCVVDEDWVVADLVAGRCVCMD
jgi:hypothetical protein